MKGRSLLLRMFLAALTAVCFQCSSLNEVPLAGGSGAGNPGGTVSIALAIFTDTVTTDPDNPPPSQMVKDLGGLDITITSVSLNSSGLRLFWDEKEEWRCVLDSFQNRSPYLSSDSQSLIINKQFSFDALNGRPDSTIPPVTMPVARYTGVQLNFNQTSTDEGWKSKIFIAGWFMHEGLKQEFSVDINRTFSHYYKFVGGSFALSPDDTTHLELRFNASQWFRRVNFKELFDDGAIIFNPRVNLVISSNSPLFEIQEIENHIKTDFINSGKLAVY